jgi:hypothetical protein
MSIYLRRLYPRRLAVSLLWGFGLLVATQAAHAQAATAEAAQDGTYKVRMNGIDLGLDPQTGSIEYLSSPATGMFLEGTPEQSGLLDLAYPTSEFEPLRLATRFSKAEIERAGDGVQIRWKALGASRSNFAPRDGYVSAQVTIRPAPDGRSLILACEIQNHTQAPIPQTLFPDLWGLVPSHGIEETELRFTRGVVHPFTIPYRRPESAPEYYKNVGWQQYSSDAGYYRQNALRWLDFGGLGGGWSAFQRKWGTGDHPAVLTYRSEADPLHLRLAWQHKASILPGQTWNSGEFWLTPHPGGWAKGIEVFRDYVRQANPPRELPKHIRDGLGFQTIWMRQPPETDPTKFYFRYNDLPRVAEDAQRYGIDELVPWIWDASVFTLPVRLNPAMGTQEELLDGIRKAKALGVNVAPFVSIRILVNRDAARYGVGPQHDDWTYHPDLIPQFQPYYTHDFETAHIPDDNVMWQQDVQATLTDWVKRGVSSFVWDVFMYSEPSGQKPALIKVIEAVRNVARSADPQSTFAAESVTDLELDGQILDYTWNWLDHDTDALNQTVDAGPLVSVLRSPRLNCNIDDSPMAVKKCFAEGLFLNIMPSRADGPNATALISDKPPLAAALKSVAALHTQFLSYFVEGNALGDSVLEWNANAFVRAYSREGGLLVFVLNNRNKAQRVVVKSDLSLWLPASRSYTATYYDQSGKKGREQAGVHSSWLGMTDLLQPGEMAAFEIHAEQAAADAPAR